VTGPVLPTVWRFPEPLGAAAGGAFFGGTAAPLLAGFSLAAVVALANDAARGLRGDVAVALFAAAAALLLFAVQAAAAASTYSATPAERLGWFPQASHDDAWLRKTRDEQWRDAGLAAALRHRLRIAYNLGILAFLGGLVAALTPGPGDWTAPRYVGLAVVVSAVALEISWWSRRPRAFARWLAPDWQDAVGAPPPRDPLRRRTPDPVDADALRGLLGPAAGPPSEELEVLRGRVDALQQVVATHLSGHARADVRAPASAGSDGR
jgi:hypothetical protein